MCVCSRITTAIQIALCRRIIRIARHRNHSYNVLSNSPIVKDQVFINDDVRTKYVVYYIEDSGDNDNPLSSKQRCL